MTINRKKESLLAGASVTAEIMMKYRVWTETPIRLTFFFFLMQAKYWTWAERVYRRRGCNVSYRLYKLLRSDNFVFDKQLPVNCHFTYATSCYWHFRSPLPLLVTQHENGFAAWRALGANCFWAKKTIVTDSYLPSVFVQLWAHWWAPSAHSSISRHFVRCLSL